MDGWMDGWIRRQILTTKDGPRAVRRHILTTKDGPRTIRVK